MEAVDEDEEADDETTSFLVKLAKSTKQSRKLIELIVMDVLIGNR